MASQTRGRSSTVPANQHTSVSAKTLSLFTTASSDDAATASTADADAVDARAKNPRWVASREKEVLSEAIREKMLALVADIEAEEAKERPALKKSWLRDKKVELRRLSFKQPDGILAGEAFFRKARQKLRKARRGSGGADDSDEDSERNGDAGDEDEENAASSTAAAVGGAAARQTTRKFRREKPSDDETSNADSAFNVNPSGRLARPNPRVVEAETADDSKKAGWRKPMKKMSKVVRFPLDSGYKLGRLIRKRRDKQKLAKSKVNGEVASDEGSADASDDGGRGGGEWGERVATPEELQARRRSTGQQSLSSDDGDGGPPVTLVVINDADDETAVGGVANSATSGSVADIPVLQESVGRKIRDRLAIRRHHKKGGGSGSSGGDASCHDDDTDGDQRRKKKGKEQPGGKRKKDKERKDGKKEKPRAGGHDDVDDEKENGGVVGPRTARARSNVTRPAQSIELEDA